MFTKNRERFLNGDIAEKFFGAVLEQARAAGYLSEDHFTVDGRRRLFVFRRDPRDISTVSFWDPELQRYSTIPYRNTTHPPISIWELRELRGKLHEAGRAHIDEAAIFEAYRRLREREARAVSETQRTRRARARRPQSVRREAAVVPSAATTESVAPSISIEHITPFEIEEL